MAGLLFASCVKEDHAVNQRVTYYPVFNIAGGNTVAWQLGDSWVDPGYAATLNGEDVTAKVEVISDVDTETPGIYNIDYVFTNEDGFEGSVSRTVVVYDIANASDLDIAGTYSKLTLIDAGDDMSSRVPYTMTVTPGPGAGLFYMQDLLCGYFSIGRGYGSAYAFYALIQLNKDNSIDLLQTKNAWPYAILDNGGSNYDPENGAITVNWFWAGWGDDLTCVYAN